jgi:hypothetical protein
MMSGDRLQHGTLQLERILHLVEDDEGEPPPQPGSDSGKVVQKRACKQTFLRGRNIPLAPPSRQLALPA